MCAMGSFSVAGQSKCTPCPAGGFQPSVGSKSCLLCPAGKYSAFAPSGSTSCAPCALGHFSVGRGRGACTGCAAGRYGDGTSLSASCTGPCPKGKYSAKGAQRCAGCPRGHFASKSGSAECVPCASGRFAPYVYTGSTQCSLCSAGRFSRLRAPRCTSCAPGKYAPKKGSDECSDCPTGKFSPAVYSGIAQCTLCPQGQTSHQGSPLCSQDKRAPLTAAPTPALTPRAQPASKAPVQSAITSCAAVVLSDAAQAVPAAPPPGGGVWVPSERKGGESRARCMGRYTRKSLLSFAQRPVYAMANAPASCHVLYYAATVKMWVVSAELGLPPYFLAVRSDADTPEAAAGVWTVADVDASFRPVPTISVGCGQTPPTAAPTVPPTAEQGAALRRRAPTRASLLATRTPPPLPSRAKIAHAGVSALRSPPHTAVPNGGSATPAARRPPSLHVHWHWIAGAFVLGSLCVAIALHKWKSRDRAAAPRRKGDDAYQSLGGMELVPNRGREHGDVYEVQFDTWSKIGLRLSSRGVVTETAIGSQAARGGIRVGDQIVAVNSRPTAGKAPPYWQKGQGIVAVQLSCGAAWFSC